ncbi:hypothetical protein [Paraburkholderia adhaesiva]|uniref:hypothetical protein n=1 Tax=Paraburkholderia adhaesiva TaxID=2883244 RepID=UPI001F1784C4|nr:hypothetical protein [Paraburkholderia adhaesiva]
MDQLIRITTDVVFAAVVLGSEWGAEYRLDAGNSKAVPAGSQMESGGAPTVDEAPRAVSVTGAAQMAMF